MFMPRAIITDIEGTTTDIAFVHEVLFPYAQEHLATYVRTHAQHPDVKTCLQEVARLAALSQATPESCIPVLEQWMKNDEKITPLKTLQGLLWAEGYKQKAFTGHIYADAIEQLRAWHKQSIKLYVYSSGSVQAQKLIFGYSCYGDVTSLFDNYFDTHIGGKKEAASYTAIAKAIKLPPQQCLFLSDMPAECAAAQQAQMHTVQVQRDKPLLLSTTAWPVVASFTDISWPSTLTQGKK